jgi:hypothetical protein
MVLKACEEARRAARYTLRVARRLLQLRPDAPGRRTDEQESICNKHQGRIWVEQRRGRAIQELIGVKGCVAALGIRLSNAVCPREG